MSKSTTTPQITNLRFAVSETVQLSTSTWQTPAGEVHSIALFRKVGGKWTLDSETLREFLSLDDQDGAYRATDYGYGLVCEELGYKPERFFRNNFIGGK